jgi:hypothetical protein
VISREVVVKCMLGNGCIGFKIVAWVRVNRVSPWWERDAARGVAKVFFFKMCLECFENLRWVCYDVIGGRVSYGGKVRLVFCVGL